MNRALGAAIRRHLVSDRLSTRPIRAASVRARQYSTESSVDGIRLPTLEDLYLKEGDNVVVAMSGGVDSSLTLRLLRELPLNLSVLFMRNWDPLLSESATDNNESPTSLSYGRSGPPGVANFSPCSWERDWADVHRVCAHVGIPQSDIQLVDLSREYWSRVFEPAVEEWSSGRTPNPDVACNREIKFGALMNHVKPGHFLATGHYARVTRSPEGIATLHRARDMNKDQTYYLSQVPSRQLARAVFPLAGIPKPRVRDLSRHFGLPTADRDESMGVCFIGERGKFGDFVSQYTPEPASTGHFVNLTGKRIAPHRGLHHYTIGQRPKLGGMPGRWFVSRKGVGARGDDILLVPGHDHPTLQCEALWSTEFNWIAGEPPAELQDGGGGHLDALVQVRHRMAPVKARVSMDIARGDTVRVEFPVPVVAVAAGQIVGVWRGDQCLGSGVIDRTLCAE